MLSVCGLTMSVIILAKYAEEEYEIAKLVNSLSNKNILVQVCHPDHFDLIVDSNNIQGIKYEGKLIPFPKLVLVKMGAGITNTQLAVIRQFEQAGITCVNSSSSIESAIDKLRTSQILSSNNIAIPNTMMVRFPVNDTLVLNKVGFPCVVKVITGTHGEGVYLCDTQKSFVKVMEFISNVGNQETLIVQEYLGEHPGEDLRVLVIGGKVFGAMKRTAPLGDFRANITSGGTGEAFEVTPEIEKIAQETAQLLGLEIAGIDLLFDSRGFRVCEANSNPGFRGFEKYCNTNVADQIAEYIKFKIHS